MINLFWIFLKIGFFGFGGGYAMLSLIYNDSLSLGITTMQFAELNALDLLAPGPIAVNSATYVGMVTFGVMGAILATIAVCISSFVLSSVLIHNESRFLENRLMTSILEYTKIASLGLIISVSLSLMQDALTTEQSPILVIVTLLLTALLRLKYKVNTILVLVIMGMFGGLCYLML